MNKDDLKKTLRPIIKECVRDIIFEEGFLSTVISEVIKGTSGSMITESRVQPQKRPSLSLQQEEYEEEKRIQKLKETKRKMLDSIGRDAYKGVDLFEGTEALPSHNSRNTGESSPYGSRPLDGVDPRDPGVDLSSLGIDTGIWKKLSKGK